MTLARGGGGGAVSCENILREITTFIFELKV